MYISNILEDKLRKTLNNKQYNIATTHTEKTAYRRVRGSAGSGKSLALAGRAAKLASEGKSVLVCNYNRSLLGYLKDLVNQFIDPIPPQIEFINFHRWCRLVCHRTGFMKDYNQIQQECDIGHYTKKEFFDFKVPELVSRIYDYNGNNSPTYDAILLDEGHDFKPYWWSDVLRKAIPKDEGEALFVCDKTQNIYDNAEAWTDQTMEDLDCGFTGRWTELSGSYRLPGRIIPILDNFANKYLIPLGVEVDIPCQESTQINLLDRYRWVQVSSGISPVETCVEEILCLRKNHSIPTVYFLSTTDKIGEGVVSNLIQRGVDIFSTYKNQNAKLNLHPGCADIVATTVHSFKGWEASHLIVHVENIESRKDRAVFYTALSRLKKHDNGAALTVVSSCQNLEKFGRSNFPDFLSPEIRIMDSTSYMPIVA